MKKERNKKMKNINKDWDVKLKKIVMENIKTADEPYFKNNELWMLGDGKLVSGWYSSPCKILEQN